MRRALALLLGLSVLGCADDGSEKEPGPSPEDSAVAPEDTATTFEPVLDEDGDGYDDELFGGMDCDDGDAAIYPDATETCDGVDETEDPVDIGVVTDDKYAQPGSVYVVYDPIDASGSVVVELTTDWVYGHAGYAMAPAGDQDGDGYDDLMVGLPGASGTGTYAGAAALVFGPAASGSLEDAEVIVEGVEDNDGLGWAMAAVGDVAGDGAENLRSATPRPPGRCWPA